MKLKVMEKLIGTMTVLVTNPEDLCDYPDSN